MQLIDITGQRFGELTALHTVPKPASHASSPGAWWRCRCVCGAQVTRSGNALRNNKAKTCGHRGNLTDRVYGFITVLSRAPTPPNEKNSFWHCRCKCGNLKTIRATTLVAGKAKSCGCHTQAMLEEWNKGKRKPWSKRSSYYDPSVTAP